MIADPVRPEDEALSVRRSETENQIFGAWHRVDDNGLCDRPGGKLFWEEGHQSSGFCDGAMGWQDAKGGVKSEMRWKRRRMRPAVLPRLRKPITYAFKSGRSAVW